MSKKPQLEDLPGVGPKLEEKLREAGIKTVQKLSKATPDKLASKVDGLSESRAESLIEAAQKALPKKDGKKKESKKKEAKKEKPKPKKAEAKTEKPKTPKLQDLPGVGPKMAETLQEAGIKSVKKLASTDVEKLAKLDGIGDTTAESLIEAAEKALPEAPAPKKKEKAKKKAKKPKAKKKKAEVPVRMQKIDQRLLRIAINKKKHQPQFRADQAHRWIRVKDRWRNVRGIDSYTRQKKKGRIAMVSSGYRTPKAIRHLHPSMFEEVLVHRPEDLTGLDADIHAVRIGASVGERKRQLIIAEADNKSLRVLNPGTTEEFGEEDLFTDLDLEED